MLVFMASWGQLLRCQSKHLATGKRVRTQLLCRLWVVELQLETGVNHQARTSTAQIIESLGLFLLIQHEPSPSMCSKELLLAGFLRLINPKHRFA